MNAFAIPPAHMGRSSVQPPLSPWYSAKPDFVRNAESPLAAAAPVGVQFGQIQPPLQEDVVQFGKTGAENLSVQGFWSTLKELIQEIGGSVQRTGTGVKVPNITKGAVVAEAKSGIGLFLREFAARATDFLLFASPFSMVLLPFAPAIQDTVNKQGENMIQQGAAHKGLFQNTNIFVKEFRNVNQEAWEHALAHPLNAKEFPINEFPKHGESFITALEDVTNTVLTPLGRKLTIERDGHVMKKVLSAVQVKAIVDAKNKMLVRGLKFLNNLGKHPNPVLRYLGRMVKFITWPVRMGLEALRLGLELRGWKNAVRMFVV